MFGFLSKKKIKVVTHDGGFHADEVFAMATLEIWADKNGFKLEVSRSRDAHIINKSDIVLDVGGVYDVEKRMFDHHQTGGAGVRISGIPYATFGLVWKEYGPLICENEYIVERIENNLVIPIDAGDNGLSISNPVFKGVYEYNVSLIFQVFRPEEWEDYVGMNNGFKKAVAFAKDILEREIYKSLKVYTDAEEIRKEIKNQNTPSILILESKKSWREAVSKYPEIKIVVSKGLTLDGEEWSALVAEDDPKDHSTRRAFFPSDWAGKMDQELVQISGVSDAVFCHNGLWLAKARSKEGAIKLAEKALSV